MHNVTLLGAGKIGIAIAALLGRSGRYNVKVCDISLERAQHVANKFGGSEARKIHIDDQSDIENSLRGACAVVSALPFHCNRRVAECAEKLGVHYLDLTEDVETTKAVRALSEGAKCAFLPQCGLAPGYISVAGAHLASSFEKLDSLRMRVGALPIYPSNRLKYNLTWSTEGLINEYCNSCEAIIDGKFTSIAPLEGYERFSLDGVEYEAFNTSGGLGSLSETLAGRVWELNYKTIRYPGHRELMSFLLNDLRFIDDRENLRQVFERSIPTTPQDKCIIFVEGKGTKGGRFTQETVTSTVYHQEIDGYPFSAIQITTAAGICAPLDLLLTNKLPRSKGFIRCEEIALSAFHENEFGRWFNPLCK